MKKKFAQIRTKHLLILMCMPNFWWFDSKYRENMFLFWIHNLTRGFGIIFTAAQNIGLDDVWHRKKFIDVKQRFDVFTDYNDMKKVYDKHPCYFDYIKIKPCNPDIYAEYKKLRDAAVWDSNTTPIQPQKYMLKSIVYNLYTKLNNGGLTLEGKLTYQELARQFLYDPIKDRPFYDDTSGRDMVGTWVREVKAMLGENNNTDTE